MNASAIQWRDSLVAFFDERSAGVSGAPSHEDLCYISGREPRLWSDQVMLDSLGSSIISQMASGPESRILEVGSAAGFLAKVVAPRVKAYTGVDVSKGSIAVAKRLGIDNAEFLATDGTTLPFESGKFDAGFCYDVFTNFPSTFDGERIISEMLRAVRPGGRVLVGSIPDSAKEAEYPLKVADVARYLDETYGPAPVRSTTVTAATVADNGMIKRALLRLGIVPPPAVPEIICYYFPKADFELLARKLRAEVTFFDIHSDNPYVGFRYNAVFTRDSS